MKIKDIIVHIALRIMIISLCMIFLLLFTKDIMIRFLFSFFIVLTLEITGILKFYSPSDIEKENTKEDN